MYTNILNLICIQTLYEIGFFIYLFLIRKKAALIPPLDVLSKKPPGLTNVPRPKLKIANVII